jgi:cysteinyl-tRNA synthetase
MPLRVYNTLSQSKEDFEPIDAPNVGMYVCGPTVYSASHIGHMVGPVIFDTVKRYLSYLGYQVKWVVNITDVDDKLIVQANKDGTSVKDLAEAVTADYIRCLEALSVTGIDHMPRATDNIDQILEITGNLVEQGYAYPSGGDVYFDVSRDEDYGKLSHRDPEELKSGARIEPSSLKKHPGDFALWKGSKPGEPAWESNFGPGRPGWHIECSAMSMRYLGPSFDIHGGGLDLVFPHHENELAQSESHNGKPFVKYWMHNGLLTRNGRKISKSDPDTIVLMKDLLEKFDPDVIRALLVSSHYRSPIDFGNSRLEEIGRALKAFRNLFDRFARVSGLSFYTLAAPTRAGDFGTDGGAFLEQVAEHRRVFLDAMDDDFNTGAALAELYELVRTLNRFADTHAFDSATGANRTEPESVARDQWILGMVVLRELTLILGLFEAPPAVANEGGDSLANDLMELVLHLRAELRKAKNFALADQIRDRLTALRIVLEDRPGGQTTWKRD